MELIKFPSIGQFRNAVSNVNHSYNYIGQDENGDPIYDVTKEKPILTFKGSCKLHGTNAAICYNDNEFWVQSHKQLITPQKDNAGFAFFAESHKDVFIKICTEIKEKHNIDTLKETICVYGEWAGKGIQSGVGINNIPKSFFIFGVKVSKKEMETYEDGTQEEVKIGRWLDCEGYRDIENRIYNVNDFKTYTIDIDFNHPELSQNKIIEQTLEVEAECPVAKEFGFDGTVGEGIVYTCVDGDSRYQLKSKGLIHSKSSKVKVLKPVDNEKINKLIEMAEQVTPTWRLEQFLNEACNLNNGGEITRDKIPAFIRGVINDVLKEELDVLAEADIEPKQINKYISNICREYFFNQEKM